MAFDLSQIKTEDDFFNHVGELNEQEIQQLIETGVLETECEFEDDIDEILNKN